MRCAVSHIHKAQNRTPNHTLCGHQHASEMPSRGHEHAVTVSSRGHQVWVGAGLAEVMRQYEWARVGVINEDTTWGSGSADAFIEVGMNVIGA